VNQRGYTLIEMLVAISISTLLILLVGYFATNSIVSTNQDYNKTLVLTNAKEAVGIVARQVRLARSVLSSNGVPDDNAPGAPGNKFSWSGAASASNATLVLAVPSLDSSGNIMFVDPTHTSVYTDNVIFYLDSSSKRLYRRWLVNDVAAAAGSKQKTTCPPALATSICPADADVVDDVANLGTIYLDGGGNPITNPANTEAVNFTVTETRAISGRTYSGTYSTIATLRNR
jgi:prepilin-type N-terminal cleavage/methylation domain-containing protein